MMKRKHFLQSTALTIGALSINSIINALDAKSLIKESTTDLSPKVIRNGEGETQMVLGDNQTLKLTGDDTNGLYTVIEQYNNPGMEIPLHVHQDEDEVFHVLEGELEIQVGKEKTILQAGDMGFCPRGIPHSWKVVGDQKAKVMLSIFPSGLERMFHEFAALPAGPPDFKKVTAICKKYNIQFV